MALSKDENTVDSFAKHCKELIRRCTTERKVNYRDFTRIWQEMQFERIYEQMSSGAEIAELSEEFIHVARRFMVSTTSTYEESVTALFIMYSLLNLQSCAGIASLHLVQEDRAVLNWIEAVAKREYRIDILYILGSVLLKGSVPCDYRPKEVLQAQEKVKDLIKQIEVISGNISKLQQDISDPNLNNLDENLATSLRTSFQQLVIGGDSDESGASTSGQANEFAAIRAIKQQAMTSKVNPANHLDGLNDMSAATSSKSGNKRLKGKGLANKSNHQGKRSKKHKRSNPIDNNDETDDTDDDYSTTNVPENVEDCQKIAKTEDEDNYQTYAGPSTLRLIEGGAGAGQEVVPTINAIQGIVFETKPKRLEKRVLKRTILRSRLKRLGLLEVANFPPE